MLTIRPEAATRQLLERHDYSRLGLRLLIEFWHLELRKHHETSDISNLLQLIVSFKYSSKKYFEGPAFADFYVLKFECQKINSKSIRYLTGIASPLGRSLYSKVAALHQRFVKSWCVLPNARDVFHNQVKPFLNQDLNI